MTTKSALKTQLLEDLDNAVTSAQAGTAIDAAIDFYQMTRFHFNTKRSVTFNTVAAQARYTSSDSSSIPNLFTVDMAYLTNNSLYYPLCRVYPADIEMWLASNTGQGVPSTWAYFDESVWLYPTPDAAYPVRFLAHIKIDGPASDTEASNSWMTKAYELIRCRSRAYLATHILRDTGMAQLASAGESAALARLRREVSRRESTGQIQGSEW